MTLVIILGLALVVSLAFNFGILGGKHPAALSSASGPSPRSEGSAGAGEDRTSKLEADFEKKKKELEELRKTHNEAKDELKSAKKRLHEHKEANKTGDDLSKARGEVERQASIQLENTRHELANALAELQRLKGELEGGKGRRPPPAQPQREERKDEPRREIVIQKVVRELSDAEKEKMGRLELQSAQDKRKAIEAAAEMRSLKAKIDREKREAKRVYEEGRLAHDKYRAVEIRLNRVLLESDLLKRAILDLEKKTGQHAEHTVPTTEELTASDTKMREKYAAEDKAAEETRQKLEAAEVKAEQAAAVADAATANGAPAAAPSTTA